MTTPRMAAPPVHLPQHIGRYRVVERIGRGAMGVVYAVEDEAMGRRAAVKMITAGLQEDPEIRERFYREARVTGQIAHRNIVTVFDFGEDQGRPYMVMELLAGLPLADFMRTPAARPLGAKLDLMMQLCDGLQVAHSHGVIHRDVKPGNLFVQGDGSLKILDFGVARLVKSSLTASAFLVGTLEYMAPEQAQGDPIDARADLFAAGCVCHFMLKGRSPFASSDLQAMLHAIAFESPPALTDDDAPEALRRVLVKALSKAPGDRYQQAGEMLADLDRVRRAEEGATYRIVQAALDRYGQILATIEERRALGRSSGASGVDASCETATARLAARFPLFAEGVDPLTSRVPMDRATASDILAALQVQHNAEVAALAALSAEAADVLRREPGRTPPDRPLQSGDAPVVSAPSRRTPPAAAPTAPENSFRARAAAAWRRLWMQA